MWNTSGTYAVSMWCYDRYNGVTPVRNISGMSGYDSDTMLQIHDLIIFKEDEWNGMSAGQISCSLDQTFISGLKWCVLQVDNCVVREAEVWWAAQCLVHHHTPPLWTVYALGEEIVPSNWDSHLIWISPLMLISHFLKHVAPSWRMTVRLLLKQENHYSKVILL